MSNAASTNNASQTQTSVDAVVATNIAANLAETTNLSVANNVANMSVALKAESELAQANGAITSKPQILQTTAESRVVTTYITVPGDTVDTVATRFSLTKETIRWANNLTTDAIPAGKTLKILPVDGITYTVKSNDTVQSIATKYSADASRVVLYNDLDINTQITAGQELIVPGGVLPDTERPGYIAPRVINSNSYGSGGSNASNTYRASAGNRYSYGYCTWYVYERRAELGRPIGSFWGNAANWSYAAVAAGFTVNNKPEVGAILEGGGLDYRGHVAVVESIAANGDITLSEMNYGGGWNKIYRGRVITAGQASLYNYIH